MTTLTARFGIIGYFIMKISLFFQNPAGCFIHCPFFLFGRDEFRLFSGISALHIFFIKLIKRRTFFNDKAVGRNMLRLQCEDLTQRLFPALLCLSRKCRHKIHIDIGKTGFSCQLKAFQKFFPGMDPAQLFQFFRIGRLKAKA